jgi:DNA-binding response OmpR family regulator
LESKFILPDIIILDLVMPSIDGKIVLKRIKEIAHVKNIPVIIHSSMNNYENIIKMNKLEAMLSLKNH